MLVLNGLPEVGVECPLGYIAAYMNELVLIALTLNAAFSLREITGTPRAIQIVKCDQTILHVGARAHLGRAAHQDAHLTAAYLCEQFPLFDLRIGVVDERDLFWGHTGVNEFLTHILIDRKRRVRAFFQRNCTLQRMDFRAVQRTGRSLCCPLRGCGLWRRNVAEHKLCQLIRLAVAPVLENVRHTLIDLGRFLVGEHGIDDALVKSQLASVRGDFEHIVHIRADRTAVYLGRSFREGFHHVLLDLCGFGGDGVIRNLRRG